MMAAGVGRSWLYVPGDRPDRFAKASTSGADVVICDLEDAVAGANKATARVAVAAWLRDHRALVRVNGTDTRWHDEDIAAITGARGLAGVVLPKSQGAEQISDVAHRLGDCVHVMPLVESAAGVANAAAIAAGPQVSALAFGSIDFALDIGIDDTDDTDDTALLYARSTLVIASRVAGIAAPIDGVTLKVSDAHAVRGDARRARPWDSAAGDASIRTRSMRSTRPSPRHLKHSSVPSASSMRRRAPTAPPSNSTAR